MQRWWFSIQSVKYRFTGIRLRWMSYNKWFCHARFPSAINHSSHDSSCNYVKAQLPVSAENAYWTDNVQSLVCFALLYTAQITQRDFFQWEIVRNSIIKVLYADRGEPLIKYDFLAPSPVEAERGGRRRKGSGDVILHHCRHHHRHRSSVRRRPSSRVGPGGRSCPSTPGAPSLTHTSIFVSGGSVMRGDGSPETKTHAVAVESYSVPLPVFLNPVHIHQASSHTLCSLTVWPFLLCRNRSLTVPESMSLIIRVQRGMVKFWPKYTLASSDVEHTHMPFCSACISSFEDNMKTPTDDLISGFAKLKEKRENSFSNMSGYLRSVFTYHSNSILNRMAMR